MINSQRRFAVFSIDVEQDISKYIKNGHQGMEYGLPRIMNILRGLEIRGTFFWTGAMAKKYPDQLRKCIEDGHEIGCHGLDHSIEYYNHASLAKQETDISKAKKILETMTGRAITSFRAPNFSLGESTLEVIEKLGFTVDSSVMPGRFVKKWKLFTLLDFRDAPFSYYRLSLNDVKRAGNSNVIEFPPAMNWETLGTPIGLGLLNARGKKAFFTACEKSTANPVILVSHPWEAVRLDTMRCPGWVHRACRDEMDLLRTTLYEMQERWKFITLDESLRELTIS